MERYADALYRWAWVRARGDADLAQEIVQGTFAAAFERPGAYDPARGEPWGWLLGLAMNQLKAERRQIGRLRVGTAPDRSREQAPAVEIEEERRCVQEALTELEPWAQALLEGHYVQGQTMEELARELKVTPSTAWEKLAQARRQFAAAFRARGGVHD